MNKFLKTFFPEIEDREITNIVKIIDNFELFYLNNVLIFAANGDFKKFVDIVIRSAVTISIKTFFENMPESERGFFNVVYTQAMKKIVYEEIRGWITFNGVPVNNIIELRSAMKTYLNSWYGNGAF
jgi:hypothetical protein